MTAPSLGRPGSLDAPDRLTTVLELADELADVARATDGLTARIEGVTGLRRGELAALLAVDQGARHPRAVARRNGQVDDVGTVTTEALVRRGLLRRAGHPAAPAGAAGATVLEVTAMGRVVVDQAAALRIRALGSVVGALGARDTAVLRAAIQALTDVLDDARDDAADGARGVSQKRLLPGHAPARPVES